MVDIVKIELAEVLENIFLSQCLQLPLGDMKAEHENILTGVEGHIFKFLGFIAPVLFLPKHSIDIIAVWSYPIWVIILLE